MGLLSGPPWAFYQGLHGFSIRASMGLLSGPLRGLYKNTATTTTATTTRANRTAFVIKKRLKSAALSIVYHTHPEDDFV